MAKSVAEIEQGAFTGFPFVGGDDLGLVAARAFDGLAQSGGVARQQRVQMRFQPVQKWAITDQSVLDHLGQTGAQFAVRQGSEGIGVRQHAARLIKRTDHVLAERMIDGGLAADRGIHLGQQRRRNLDEGHAALIAGRREASHVADHPAAESDDRAMPVEALIQQGGENFIQRLQRLVAFAVGQDDRLAAQLGQRGADAFQIQRRHGDVADHQRLPASKTGPQ